jgi:hypothetical protein
MADGIPSSHPSNTVLREVYSHGQPSLRDSNGALTSRMHKVIDPTHKPLPNGKPPFPVLILHGLFQSSGSFVTSEERSLAFWLARQGGYSVYLGNTRGVFDMGHRNLSRGDPRFWGKSWLCHVAGRRSGRGEEIAGTGTRV